MVRTANVDPMFIRARAIAFTFGIVLGAIVLAGRAHAGEVHPALEARLAALPPDVFVAVIVELEARADPRVAAASAPANRRARGRAVVQALRDVAERTQPPVRAQIAQEEALGNARKVNALWVINGIAVSATAPAIRRIAQREDVREVRLDVAIAPPVPRPASVAPEAIEAAWNIDHVRAPEAWALGFDGSGVVIGSFDTGVDGTHPELAPRYRGNHAISWFDPYGEHAAPFDNNGHGTHTVGTALGGDLSGYAIGVAPGARWIAAKGWRDDEDATASAFHQIFQWFLAPGGDPANAPDIVNNSWGMEGTSCQTEFRADVQALRAAGIVPVFASGNSGPGASTVLSPGNYAESFTVGSTGFEDEVSFFSSEGPSQCDGAVKPNVSAPGEFILSTFPGDYYIGLDGTSMAAPHISGAAALLRSIDPDLTVDEVEAAIVRGAVDLGPAGPDNGYGAGRLDVMESALIILEGLGKPIVGIAATTPSALEAGSVAGVFTLSRRGSTDAALTVTYSVSGSATPGSDYVALSGTATLPIGAASASIAVTPVDDALVELDETIVVRLDPSPAYVAAPAVATVTLVSDEIPPDLVVSALTVPSTAGAGAPITLAETTRNAGGGPSDASTTRYYFSTNSTLDAGDVLLGSRAVPALAPGASDAATVVLTIPASAASGPHYVIARADADDALIETQEANNAQARAVLVGPDLIVSTFTVPGDSGAGRTMSVADTVRNQGGGSSAAATVTFYLSSNAVLEASDTVLGSRALAPLGPNASDAATTTVTIPEGTPTGTYYVFARADSGEAVAETYESNNTSSRTVRVGPDLQVASFASPGSAGAGATITVSDTTRNAGGGMAAASTTRFYFSANSALDEADVLLGARNVAALEPSAADAGSVVLVIPAGTASGTYYLIAEADGANAVTETQEANNRQARAIQVGIDLAVTSLTVPSDGAAGASIALGDTTKNLGAGAAAASTTSYYLSADATLDAGDILLASRAVPALDPNASDSGSVSATIPAAAATGTYYVFAKADAPDLLAETYESNNAVSRTLRIGPDLQVASFSAPSTAGAGATLSVSESTRNAGAGAAAASTTTIFLSANAILDAGDVALASRAVPALAAGTTDNATLSVTIPATTASGTYYLIAQADSGAAVVETLESNNGSARAIQVGADLVVASLTVPADSGEGASITISETTRNQGGGTAPASTTTYYLSSDATLDAADAVLGSRAVPPLAAGASDAASVAVTIPAGTATGTWYVFARADSANAVVETVEANNTMSRTLRVGADLTVASFGAPATASAGAAIAVSDTTRNAGGGAAAASATRFYLSTNSTLDAADIALAQRAVPPLAAGGSSSASTPVTIPEGTAAGAYYLFAVADGAGGLAETQETNNAQYRSILIGNDLQLTAFTVPATSGAGLTITLTDTTRNFGAGLADATTTSYYLSANATLDAGDLLLGSRAVPALPAGASSNGSIAITIPEGTPTGIYNVFAKADAGDVLVETYENNNTLSRSLRIGPDLVVTTLTAPASVASGATLSVSDGTRNSGGGAAVASVTRIYLSTNATLEAGDILLGERAVGMLGAAATDTGSIAIAIPAGTPAGSYYLVADSDSTGVVVETSETNNRLARAIQVIAP